MRAHAGYRPEIDGLRAIAVLSVVLFHFGAYGVPGGFVGVDIFFVISGFLITSKIVSQLQKGQFSFVSFYVGRVKRLAPALFVLMIFTCAAGSVLLLPDDLVDYARSAISTSVGFANWYFFYNTDYFDAAAAIRPLLHTWSLGVEEQFYFCWPVVAWIVMSRLQKPSRYLFCLLAIISLVSFAASVVFVSKDPKQAFYLPHLRFWELAIGGLTAFAPDLGFPIDRKLMRFVGLGAIGLSIALYSPLTVFPGFAALLPCIGASLILWPLHSRTPVEAILTSRIMVIIGKISYSLYLWHWPILVFYLYRTGHHPDSVPEYTGLLLLIFAISYLSWAFVEQPIRKGSFSPRAVFSLLGTSVIFSVSAAFVLIATGGLTARYTQQELAIIRNVPVRGIIEQDGVSCSRRPVDSPCTIGDRAQTPTWAVLGDSHAETLLKALDQGFQKRHVAAVVFTFPGCPFIMNVIRLDTRAECGSFTERAFEELERRQIKDVLIQDRSNAYLVGKPYDNGEGGVEPSADFPVSVKPFDGPTRKMDVQGQLEATLERLLRDHRNVYYFLAPPEVGWNLPKKVIQQMQSRQPMPTTSFDRYMERNAPLMDLLKRYEVRDGFHLIPSYRPFCDDESRRCETVAPAGLLYTDTDHLSTLGADRLTNLFFRILDQGAPSP